MSSSLLACVAWIGWATLTLAQGAAVHAVSAEEAIRQVLTEQADAWNSGDLDGFMRHYLQSDALSFSTGGETVRGWQATFDRYRRRYPDRKAMGQLAFSNLEIHAQDSGHAFVLGDWRLERDEIESAGNFTLILRRFDGQWRIVHDHTSLRP